MYASSSGISLVHLLACELPWCKNYGPIASDSRLQGLKSGNQIFWTAFLGRRHLEWDAGGKAEGNRAISIYVGSIKVTSKREGNVKPNTPLSVDSSLLNAQMC